MGKRKPIVGLLILILLLVSCKETTRDFGTYQVVKLDYSERDHSLSRIFVVIDKDSVEREAYINGIVCALTVNYSFGSNTNVSFFSDKKYADYKTALFLDSGHELPDAIYGKWQDSFYLGEFEYRNWKYITFPSGMSIERRKIYVLQKCN